MPNANGLPLPGEEVRFADGRTEVIKRYMRSRVIGYQDGHGFYEEDSASVPVTGHVVEMAQPRKHEFVTLITFLEVEGFWQPMDPATTVSSPTAPFRQRIEAQFDQEMDRITQQASQHATVLGLNAFWRKQWVYYMGFYFFGMLVGGALAWLATR
jgi:hypothetical protein